MTKQEIKKIVQTEFISFLESEGFKKGRVPSDMIAVMEKEANGVSYQFSCHTYRYDIYSLDYGFGLGYPKVTELLQTIHDHTPIRKEITVAPKFVTGISPVLLGDPLFPGNYQPSFGTEEELKKVLKEVRSFYQQEFGSFERTYSEIQALDKVVNDLNNFRKNEANQFPPLIYLFVTRLIIARLAENPCYEEVVERNFDALEEEWARFDAIFDRTDDRRPEVFAAKFLRNISL